MDAEDIQVQSSGDTDEFENHPEGDGVIIISREGKILSSNLQAEKILQLRLPRGTILDITRVFADEYLRKAEMALRDAYQKGISHSNLIAEPAIYPGIPVSLIFSISPLFNEKEEIVGAILTFRDYSVDSHQADLSNQDRMIGYDTLFEQIAEGVFTINNRWRITSFNRQAQEITGFKREEVLGKYCWDIFRSDLCRSSCPLKVTMETGIVRMDQDVRIVVKGGEQQSILVNTSVIKNRRGLVMGAVETFRPLTPTDATKEIRIGSEDYFNGIVGGSPSLKKILSQLPDIAISDATVIIEGESGTGKELVAKAIHQQQSRPVRIGQKGDTLS